MYIYNVGIIDHFNGLTHLGDYVVLIRQQDGWGNEANRDDLASLREFVGQALTEARYAKGVAWEGDLRGEAIYVGGIPQAGTYSCDRFLVIKQDNNGSTFVMSPIAFEHLKDYLIDSGGKQKYNESDYPEEVRGILGRYFS